MADTPAVTAPTDRDQLRTPGQASYKWLHEWLQSISWLSWLTWFMPAPGDPETTAQVDSLFSGVVNSFLFKGKAKINEGLVNAIFPNSTVGPAIKSVLEGVGIADAGLQAKLASDISSTVSGYMTSIQVNGMYTVTPGGNPTTYAQNIAAPLHHKVAARIRLELTAAHPDLKDDAAFKKLVSEYAEQAASAISGLTPRPEDQRAAKHTKAALTDSGIRGGMAALIRDNVANEAAIKADGGVVATTIPPYNPDGLAAARAAFEARVNGSADAQRAREQHIAQLLRDTPALAALDDPHKRTLTELHVRRDRFSGSEISTALGALRTTAQWRSLTDAIAAAGGADAIQDITIESRDGGVSIGIVKKAGGVDRVNFSPATS